LQGLRWIGQGHVAVSGLPRLTLRPFTPQREGLSLPGSRGPTKMKTATNPSQQQWRDEMPDNMTEFQQFVVIRHGESQTNATDIFQAGNQYDSDPLTPLGMEGARPPAERFAALPVDLVLSSSYLRARTTAGLIAEATQAPHLVPVQKDSSWVDLPADDPEVRNRASLLREIDVPSELQGLKFDDPRAEKIQHAAMSVADQPDGHYSDEENLYDLWGGAEEIRRYLESRTETLGVGVGQRGIVQSL